MALNGLNLALAWNGQEAIWERVRVPSWPQPVLRMGGGNGPQRCLCRLQRQAIVET